MNVADMEAATALQERLLESYPGWKGSLRVDVSNETPVVTLSLPHRPEHELSVEICRAEATVAYSDGLPPGPAEQLFILGDDPLDEGLNAVSEYIANVVRGEVVLVRERLTRVVRILRRHDCDSLLLFVGKEEFGRWSRRRRRLVQRVWCWDGTSRLAI